MREAAPLASRPEHRRAGRRRYVTRSVNLVLRLVLRFTYIVTGSHRRYTKSGKNALTNVTMGKSGRSLLWVRVRL